MTDTKTYESDVVIIGSGIGGAACAHQLSQQGFNVIVVERGQRVARDNEDWNAKRILIDKRYRSDYPIEIEQLGRAKNLDYPNEVVGGGSVFYGGAALRMRENDFSKWPISYTDLEPYYQQAEELQDVCGQSGDDPFEPPRQKPYPFSPNNLTSTAKRIKNSAQSLGYKPFRIPVAINYSEKKKQNACESCFTCDGFPCKVKAKNDAEIALLDRAKEDTLTLLSSCVAVKLVKDEKRISHLEAIDLKTKKTIQIRAKLFISSGGAIQTPALLLRSGLEDADQSKTLGRRLMRHCNAIIGGVFPFPVNPNVENHKQICLSDLYEHNRKKDGYAVGVVQDMCMPPREAVKHLAPAGFRSLAGAFSNFIQAMICVAEDEPQLENYVGLSKEKDELGIARPYIYHQYSDTDYQRRELLIKQARQVLKKSGAFFTKLRVVDSFSHAVGSVHFSDSPEKSALDPFCKFYGLDNLYVADGSIFPTSGGVNPSLTILANALRVAEAAASSL